MQILILVKTGPGAGGTGRKFHTGGTGVIKVTKMKKFSAGRGAEAAHKIKTSPTGPIFFFALTLKSVLCVVIICSKTRMSETIHKISKFRKSKNGILKCSAHHL